MPELNRRQLLQIAGIAGASAIAGFGLGRLTATGEANAFLDPNLELLVAAGIFSPAIGEIYLSNPQSRTRVYYRSLVRDTMRGLSPDNLEADIRKTIANDFATSKLCQLEGWQLSLTECRLAGIAFLYRQFGGHIAERTQPRSLLDRLPDTILAKIDRWGPTFTHASEPFNRRPDGGSAVWIHVAEIPEYTDYQIYVGPQAANTFLSRENRLATGSLTAAQAEPLLAKPGKLPVHLVDTVRGKQLVGHIDIQ